MRNIILFTAKISQALTVILMCTAHCTVFAAAVMLEIYHILLKPGDKVMLQFDSITFYYWLFDMTFLLLLLCVLCGNKMKKKRRRRKTSIEMKMAATMSGRSL